MAKGLIQNATWRSTILVSFETSLIMSAVIAAAFVRLGSDAWILIESEGGLLKALLIAYVCQVCLYYGDLYDDLRLGFDRTELVVRILHALGATAIILSLLYYWFPRFVLGRGVFAIAAVFVAAVVLAWRVGFTWMTARVGPRERFLLVGTSAAGLELAREFHQRQDLGVEIVGFIDPDPAHAGAPAFPGVVGTIDDIPEIIRTGGVDRVVVSLSDARGKLPMDKLLEMRMNGVVFEHLASVYEKYTGKIAIENLRPSWFIFAAGFRRSPWRLAVKRGVDVVLGSLGLVLGFPLFAVLAVAIRQTSRGPVLYQQQRVGLRGELFTVYKLRSMQEDAEAATGAVWSPVNDRRVTPLGRFMRRTRLDEMPQLWNVVRGEMSLVGPRPERPEFVHELEKRIPFYGQRHIVKPGLSGWAQVRYTYGASAEDAMEKLQYDLYYIKNFRLSLDLFIIFETIKTVLTRKGH
jgi:sugar transferase (PEP-CTERM system associated)